MSDVELYTQIATLPDDLKKEVSDFVGYLVSKHNLEEKPKKKVKTGLARGLMKMSDDFDEPLDDFKEYMQ